MTCPGSHTLLVVELALNPSNLASLTLWDRLWHTHMSPMWRVSWMQVPQGFLGLPMPLGEHREPPTESCLPTSLLMPMPYFPQPHWSTSPRPTVDPPCWCCSPWCSWGWPCSSSTSLKGTCASVLGSLPSSFSWTGSEARVCRKWCPSPAHGAWQWWFLLMF